MMETKAPVLTTHWRYIAEAKKMFPKAKFILVGDHVSYFPEESFQRSLVDYVITGGDYDVLLRELANHLEGRGGMPPGLWWREAGGELKSSGKHLLDVDLDTL